MKKVMKRGFSLVLTLLMLLCMFPVSAFAANKKCTLVVGRDNAPFRTKAHQDGEIVKRYDKGKSLTYTRLYINDALNLWYGVRVDDSGDERFIYSGNVKKVSVPKGAKVAAQVEMSRSLLSQDKCLEQAKRLSANGAGYSKSYMAKEIFAHAYAYYTSEAALKEQAELYLTPDVICKYFPDSLECYTVSKITDALLYLRKCGERVEIGEEYNDEEGKIKGIKREIAYEIFWDMVIVLKAMKKAVTTIA